MRGSFRHTTIIAILAAMALLTPALASTPGADKRLTNDYPGGGYVSAYTLATGRPYTDAVIDECSIARGRQNEPAVAVDPRNIPALRYLAEIYDTQGYETEVLAASLRHPMHVVDAALAGADIATMPYDVFTKLVKHPLTDVGLEKFTADWTDLRKKLQGSSEEGA